ncbi:MAG: hypothetical protein ACYC91_00350 [Solirubrobacteraceae bacterium]
MRELERDLISDTSDRACLAIIGRGRLGTALSTALRDGGLTVTGPLGRGAGGTGSDAVLLCVPDCELTGRREAGAAPAAEREVLLG